MTIAPKQYSRRSLLALGGGLAGVVLVGCGDDPKKPAEEPELPDARVPDQRAPAQHSTAPAPSPTPTATPYAAGRVTRPLLGGTPSETEVVVHHSGKDGPKVMILGGVHGNEPGGWLAADEVATWAPAAGSLITLPRANTRAIAGFVRTTDEIGDLNRLYPGRADSDLLMERMAAEIVALAKELKVDYLIDMHESWAFYNGRAQNGTAFLGQTLTAGNGPSNPAFVETIATRANGGIEVERDKLVIRDGSPFGNPNSSRGRSSLALGAYVPGLTPVLVEMGQEGQTVERRVELHLSVARTALDELGML